MPCRMVDVQANIARVTIDGREQDRDAGLDHHQRFEVETDAGHHYVVTREGSPSGSPSEWDVTRADGSPVGHVHGSGWAGAGDRAYRYKRTGAWFSGGQQHDLWNAVQSLLE
ncbi:hypothetical protein DEI84_08405 [Curtobacterium sp. MCBD17_023]|nr:hypothetical protein DEI84_08405 [Curtobacterium sp. MCBD17_023]